MKEIISYINESDINTSNTIIFFFPLLFSSKTKDFSFITSPLVQLFYTFSIFPAPLLYIPL
eukprot:UN10948